MTIEQLIVDYENVLKDLRALVSDFSQEGDAAYNAQLERVEKARRAIQTLERAIPPAPRPEPPAPDPDDTQPVIIPGGMMWQLATMQGDWSYDAPADPPLFPQKRISRARRMMHLQCAFYQATKDERAAAYADINALYREGLIAPVDPHAVYFEWKLTDAGKQFLADIEYVERES